MKKLFFVKCTAPVYTDALTWTTPEKYSDRTVQYAFSQPTASAAYYMRVMDKAYPEGHPLRVTFYRQADTDEVVVV